MTAAENGSQTVKRIAILGNDTSSQKTTRTELVQSMRSRGAQPYLGRIWDGELNEYFGEETALFMPILASRSNTNPLRELQSMFSVARQVRKNKIDAVIIYGVKNHAAMALGASMGGVRRAPWCGPWPFQC